VTGEKSAVTKAEEYEREAARLWDSGELAHLQEAANLYNSAASEYAKTRDGEKHSLKCRGYYSLLSGISMLEMNNVKEATQAFEIAGDLFLRVGGDSLHRTSEIYRHCTLVMQQILDLNYEGARMHYGEAIKQLKTLEDKGFEIRKGTRALILELAGENSFTQAFLLYMRGTLEAAAPSISEASSSYEKAGETVGETSLGHSYLEYSKAIRSVHKIWKAKKLQEEWDLETAQKSLIEAEGDFSNSIGNLSKSPFSTPRQESLLSRVKGEKSVASGLLKLCTAFISLMAGNPGKAKKEFYEARESYREAIEYFSKAGYFGHFESVFARERYEDSYRVIRAMEQYHK